MADDLLHIEAEDEAVWARTLDALADSRGVAPSVRVWCDRCPGRDLAEAGMTKYGPLFTSSWSTPPLPAAAAVRKVARRLRWSTDGVAGTEGVIALLRLPPDLPQDYPDLMVRCPKHGDAVLRRLDVVAKVRGGRKEVMKVTTTTPRRRYRPVRRMER